MNKRSFACVALWLISILVIMPVTAQDSSGAAFPVTIEHKFGSTTITEEPQRVVSIGYTDQDALLALGVAPVAVRYWYGDAPNAIFPWAVDEAETIGAAPDVLNMPYGNLNYEAILALDPDVIIAVGAGITQEEYDLLSAIAPTVAQSGDYIDFGMPWQETTRLIGHAVGRSEQAEALIERVEGLFAAAREENPAFAGRTIVVAYNYGEARTYGYYTSQDGRGRFFTDLGFVIPDELVEIAGDSFYADLSAERIDLLDQDVIVFLGLQFAQGGREAIEDDALISQLSAVQDGRVVFIPAEFDDALQFSTVLSLEFALDGILPELQAVLDGDSPVVDGADDCEPGFRPLEHNLGELCIPQNPQRVAAIDLDVVAFMRLLGMRPVAHVADFYNNWLASTPEWEGGEAFIDGSIDVGYPANVERLLQAQPDLIITNDPDNYDQLNAIAPTVLFDIYATDSTNWADFTRYMADILNVRDEAEAIIDQTNARITALSDAYQASEPAVASVILYSEYGILSGAPYFVYNQVMAQAGVMRPESQSLNNEEFDAINDIYWATLSEEQLGMIDGDVLIMMLSQTPEELAYAEPLISDIASDPLWGALNTVQTDRFYTVPYQRWISFDPYSVNRIIDDLFLTVLETDPAEVAPNPFTTAATDMP